MTEIELRYILKALEIMDLYDPDVCCHVITIVHTGINQLRHCYRNYVV